MSGYFEIGIFSPKTEMNIGTLWRSAYQLGASGIFTIGRRYKQQASDTTKAFRHIPLRNYESFEEFYSHIPYDAMLVGVEMGGKSLSSFAHPKQAVYLLGAEGWTYTIYLIPASGGKSCLICKCSAGHATRQSTRKERNNHGHHIFR